MASSFDPHQYMPYPEGHHIKSTCLKCGRLKGHEIHDVAEVELPLICGYTWMAPYQKPGLSATFGLEQICVLPRGHDGDHMSNTKVITKNNDIKELS